MKKYRVIEIDGKFYPQYYMKFWLKFLNKWEFFYTVLETWAGASIEIVSFKTKYEAINHINTLKNTNIKKENVVYEDIF